MPEKSEEQFDIWAIHPERGEKIAESGLSREDADTKLPGWRERHWSTAWRYEVRPAKTPPVTVKIKAIDCKPGHWAVWSTVEGGEPFLNPIGPRKWSDDGEHIVFMLDSFHFLEAAPDELLELVPHFPLSAEIVARAHARDAEVMEKRPRKREGR